VNVKVRFRVMARTKVKVKVIAWFMAKGCSRLR
jgi:hypothetical protein